MKIYINNDGSISKVESTPLVATSDGPILSVYGSKGYYSDKHLTVTFKRSDNFVIGEFPLVSPTSSDPNYDIREYTFASFELALKGNCKLLSESKITISQKS